MPETLRAVPFLGSFSDEQLDDVLNSSSYIHCEPGDAIIEEGAIDSRIYILLSGEMEVRKDGKVLTSIARPGDVFGELAVVNDDKRSASVVAAKPSVCLAVDQKFLQDFKPREEDPDFYAALYEFIARITAARLQATSRRLGELELENKRLKAKLAKKDSKPVVVKKAATPVSRRAPLKKATVAAKAKTAKSKVKPKVKLPARKTKVVARARGKR